MLSRFWTSVLFLFVSDHLRFRVFLTSVVQVVEQMNKKLELKRLKTTHCKSRALFFKSAD